MNIKLLLGDITKLSLNDADVIVNAANKYLICGGGVDKAIHMAAGKELQKECNTLGGCKYGEAKLTKAYNLPFKGIIHTVAPIKVPDFYAKSVNYDQYQLLKNCYINSLQLAFDNGFKKIAFPALGCGVYGWKYEDAFPLALEIVKNFLNSHSDMEVLFIFFEEDGYEICKKIFN